MGDNNGNDLNASGTEQRAHPRVAVNIEVSFSSGSELVRSYMSNISNGGMFVEMSEESRHILEGYIQAVLAK